MDVPAVSYEGLTKRFADTLAVDDVTIDIPQGSFFGIVGPNGAGKTTMLRMSTGLLRPDSGTVSIAGRNVWDDPATAKSRFGVVPDNPTMFERLTGRELIEFNGLMRGMDIDVIAQRREALLRLLDLTESGDTVVADYSLGMTKKIAIACALLHNPSVLPVSILWRVRPSSKFFGGTFPGEARWCSPTTPWTSWSGCATTSWSSTTAG